MKHVPNWAMSIEHRKEGVKTYADKYGYDLIDYQENIQMISFTKKLKSGTCRINVYLTTMTVSTSLNHPKRGKTQLFRRRVDPKWMKRIFKNPRVHTNKGYH